MNNPASSFAILLSLILGMQLSNSVMCSLKKREEDDGEEEARRGKGFSQHEILDVENMSLAGNEHITEN